MAAVQISFSNGPRPYEQLAGGIQLPLRIVGLAHKKIRTTRRLIKLMR